MEDVFNDPTLRFLRDFVLFLTKNQLCLNWEREVNRYVFSIYCRSGRLSRHRYGVEIVESLGWFKKKILLRVEGIIEGSAWENNLRHSVGIVDFKPMLKKEIDMVFNAITHDEVFNALKQFLDKLLDLEYVLPLGYHIEVRRNNIHAKAKHYLYWVGDGVDGINYEAFLFKVEEGKRTIAEVDGDEGISGAPLLKTIKMDDDYLPLVSSIIVEMIKKVRKMKEMGLKKYVEDSP